MLFNAHVAERLSEEVSAVAKPEGPGFEARQRLSDSSRGSAKFPVTIGVENQACIAQLVERRTFNP